MDYGPLEPPAVPGAAPTFTQVQLQKITTHHEKTFRTFLKLLNYTKDEIEQKTAGYVQQYLAPGGGVSQADAQNAYAMRGDDDLMNRILNTSVYEELNKYIKYIGIEQIANTRSAEPYDHISEVYFPHENRLPGAMGVRVNSVGQPWPIYRNV